MAQRRHLAGLLYDPKRRYTRSVVRKRRVNAANSFRTQRNHAQTYRAV